MCNNGTRGVVEIAIQHEAYPSAVWSIETTPLVPLLHVQHVPFRALIDVLYFASYRPCLLV